MQNHSRSRYIILCFLVLLGKRSCTEAETECGDDVLKRTRDSEGDFKDVSTNSSCPSHFQMCSLSELQIFSIGDEVSSLCRLHTSTSHADNLVISYHTGGRKQSSTTVDQTLCHQVQSSVLNFDLVVLRPNNTNSNREARIFIFNVREETSLEVLCTARQRDGLRMVPVSNNTLMIVFILSPSNKMTIDIGLVVGLVVGLGLGALTVVLVAVLVIAICFCKRRISKSQQTEKHEMSKTD